MPSILRKPLCLLMCLLLALPLAGLAESTAPVYPGFKLVDSSRLELVSADVSVYEHEKTGALVMVLQNEDTNRTFNISFRTPVPNDKGIPHIFEHATLSGSKKYPARNIFFNLVHQTYNTFLNAMTTDVMTAYPMASLSEDQLLKYADYYTDSVFNPMLKEDEGIFREEAWRYAMADAEAPLTLDGTVYTEMQGSYTIETDAMFNFKRTLFPGSLSGNSFGGHPEHIRDMSWDDLKNYHEDYYHPSNSLSLLYGKLEKIPDFMALLDTAFSAFERREYSFPDAGYTPITQPVEASFDYAVEANSDTQNGSVVYYAFVCSGATPADEQVMDLLTTLLGEQSSILQQEMKKQLPQASASAYYDNTTPELAVVFRATGINADQAPTFRAVVDQALAHVKENGFDLQAVEAVAAATRLSLLLSTESSSVGPNLLPNIAYFWAATGNTRAYAEYVDNTANYVAFAEEGRYQKLIETFLTNNPRTALVVTNPLPGLKEQKDAALQAELAELKAGMTPEEIAAIVEDTKRMGEPAADDAAALVKQLQAVTVESLPVEMRLYDIRDEALEDNIRSLTVDAEVSSVGAALLLLDAGGLPQEDIHWFKLYTDLMGRLDTEGHDNAALSALMTRYLYGRVMRISVLGGTEGRSAIPKLRVNFIAMDEDLAPAWDLVYEVLFETSLKDAAKVKDAVSQIRTTLKSTITNNVYSILLYRAFSARNPSYAYFNYANFLDYYAFLEQVELMLDSEPEAALNTLARVREALRNRDGAITGFAGNEASQAANQTALDAFLARLDNQPRERAAYSFPAIPMTEALVIDSAVQYNLVYATWEELGLEGFEGSMDALASLVSDTYLYPLLRDQHGAYGVMHQATEDGVYILSYRDPNITETFDIYGTLAEKLANDEVSGESLQGYILSAYSYYALSQGELSGALAAMVSQADGKQQDRALTWMEQLKAVTPEQIKAYAALYGALYEKGLRSTAGGAAAINEHAALYGQILNPFSVKDTSNVVYTDLAEDDWYYAAVRFSMDSKLMDPVAGDTFGAGNPATLGEAAQALIALVGGSGTGQEAIDALVGYGLLPAGGKAEDVLSRNLAAINLGAFLPAAGVDISGAAPLPEIPDAADIAPGAEPAFRFLLENGMLQLKEDGGLKPNEALSRAELAQILFVLGGN